MNLERRLDRLRQLRGPGQHGTDVEQLKDIARAMGLDPAPLITDSGAVVLGGTKGEFISGCMLLVRLAEVAQQDRLSEQRNL